MDEKPRLFHVTPTNMAVISFLIYILLSSITFIEGVLGKIDGAVRLGIPTGKGVLIQAGILALIIFVVTSMREW